MPPENNWSLILAAGAAVRFGSPKPLAPWQETTLLAAALEKAAQVTGTNVLVVTGGHAGALAETLVKTKSVFNPHWSRGMGSSIACGAKHILERDPHAADMLLLMIDQPLVTAGHLAALLKTSREKGLCVLTSDNTTSGPPAAVPRRFFPLLCGLEGEHGLKSCLAPRDCAHVYSASALRDADTPAELQALARFARQSPGL